MEWWDVEGGRATHRPDPGRGRSRSLPLRLRPGSRPRPVLSTPPAAPETSPRPWPASVRLWPSPGCDAGGRCSAFSAGGPPRDTTTTGIRAGRRTAAGHRRRRGAGCWTPVVTPPRARHADDALLFWAGLAWPESPPRDLIALAARTRGQRAREAILVLDRALWSARDIGWSGQSLASGLPPGARPPAVATHGYGSADRHCTPRDVRLPDPRIELFALFEPSRSDGRAPPCIELPAPHRQRGRPRALVLFMDHTVREERFDLRPLVAQRIRPALRRLDMELIRAQGA